MAHSEGLGYVPRSSVKLDKFPVGNLTNMFLRDAVGSTDPNDPAPISGGLFRMTTGDPFTATYKYHETLIVLEGSFIVSDDKGHKTMGAVGDTYWIPKGATVTIETETGGLAFYTAQRSKRE
ncbi:hypothetical protein KCU88_g7358, partial [Aureobasidium melanogenum]